MHFIQFDFVVSRGLSFSLVQHHFSVFVFCKVLFGYNRRVDTPKYAQHVYDFTF